MSGGFFSRGAACTAQTDLAPAALAEQEGHYSFPSGHTSTVFVFAVYASVYCIYAFYYRQGWSFFPLLCLPVAWTCMRNEGWCRRGRRAWPYTLQLHLLAAFKSWCHAAFRAACFPCIPLLLLLLRRIRQQPPTAKGSGSATPTVSSSGAVVWGGGTGRRTWAARWMRDLCGVLGLCFILVQMGFAW